jgi:hypothetical protein
VNPSGTADAPSGRRIRIRRATLFLWIPAVAATALILLGLDSRERMVAAPLLALVNIAVGFFTILWNRDSELPIFEVGAVCVAITTLYSTYPLVGFLMADGRWTALSDNRLRQWNPDMTALGSFAWRYVIYLGTFAVAYLHVRGRATAHGIGVRRLSRSAASVLIWLFAAVLTYFAAIWIYAGVSYSPSYADVALGVVRTSRDLPHLVQQISHNVQGGLLIIKLCVVAMLLQRWQCRASRLVLLLWLGVELAATALRMGARSDTLLLLMGTALLYHRVVRPLGPPVVAAAGIGLVSAALLYGFGRDFAGLSSEYAGISYWSATNEFQTLLGTAYDLFRLRDLGAVEAIPWQVSWSEILMLIPSQFLPVAKIDPGEWYVEAFHPQAAGGLMFGVAAQAVIGYDWIELIGRGAILGVVFGLLHRVYVQHAHSFWVSLFYLYVCLWSYYTFRASTFYFIYAVLYRFLPMMIAVRVGGGLVRRIAKASSPTSLAHPQDSLPCAGS